MFNIPGNEVKDCPLTKRKVRFLLINDKEIDDWKVQMILMHTRDKSSDLVTTNDFESHPFLNLPNKIKNLKLYEYSHLFYEKDKGDHTLRYIESSKEMLEIFGYQLGLFQQGITFANIKTCYESESRKITPELNIFIFDLRFQSNSKGFGTIRSHPLDQLASFGIALIEKKKTDILKDFIIQYKRFYQDRKCANIDKIDEFYTTLDDYLKRKTQSEIDEDFDAILALAALFGLLPQSQKLIMKPRYQPTKIFSIITSLQNHIGHLETLEIETLVYTTALNGLATLLLLKKSISTDETWLTLAECFAEKQKLFSNLIGAVLSRASELELEIGSEVFCELQKVMNWTLFLKINQLDFARSYADFVREAQRKIRIEFEERERSEEEEDRNRAHQEQLTEEGKAFEDTQIIISNGKVELFKISNEKHKLPEELSRDQERILKEMRTEIDESLNKLTKRKPPGEISLGEIQDYLKAIDQSPKYFIEIFASNTLICDCFSMVVLQGIMIKNLKDLNIAYKILIQYYNSFLLTKVNNIDWIEKLVEENSQNKDMEFLSGIFQFFLSDPKIDLEAFKKLIQKWLKNIPNINHIIMNFGTFLGSFDKSDPKVSKKKEIFSQRIIDQMSRNELEKKIDIIDELVKDKMFLEMYQRRLQEEVPEESRFREASQDHPINSFNSLQKVNMDNRILKSVLHYCLARISKPTRQEILEAFFQYPEKNSLLFTILNEEFYKDTRIHQEIHKECCEIIKQIQAFGLERKWINAIKILPEEEKNFVFEQLKLIIQRNNLMMEDAEKDIKTLVQEAQKLFEERTLKISKINQFIEVYCSGANNIQEILNTLMTLRSNIDEKTIAALELPEKLKFFESYADLLNPLINSVAFKRFRKEFGEKLDYKREAEFVQTQAELFIKELNRLLSKPDITTGEFCKFFEGVRDPVQEVAISDRHISKKKSKYLLGILNYLNVRKETIRICEALEFCASFFNLANSSSKPIDSRCLSSQSLLKDFYGMSKFLAKIMNLKPENKLCEVLVEFIGANELLSFVFDIPNESDIASLKEAVNEYGEDYVSTQAVFDFGNFWNYITELNENAKKKDLKTFLKELRKLSRNPKYTHILSNFKTSKENFNGIKDLYLELTHKEEAKGKQIFRILEKSSIRFKPPKEIDVERSYEVEVVEKINEQIFTSRDIFELRDRVNLIVYSEQRKIDQREKKNYKEEELEKFRAFCSLAEMIRQISDLLNRLDFDGYPELDKLKQSSEMANIEFLCEANNFKSLYEFKEQLEIIFQDWSYSVQEAYRSFYELTYLKGEDFWKVESALTQSENPNKNALKGVHLLRYMGKEFSEVKLDLKVSPKDRLVNLGEALKGLQEIYKFKREDNMMANKNAFIIVEVSEIAVIKGLVTLYLTYEKMLPHSSQLIVCHASTSWNELMAFAFRCFFDPHKRLFCLIQPERLSFSLQEKFSVLLKKLSSDYPEEKFQLAFVTLNLANHLIKSFNIKGYTRILKTSELLSKEELKSNLDQFLERCWMVSSSIPGLGKTTWAQNFVERQGLKYCKVPISGKICPTELGEMLLAALQNERPALCFSVGSINQEDRCLLNEMLFSLTALRSYHSCKNIIEIPTDIPIIFDLDSSSFENITTDIEILGYVQSQDIKKMNLNEVIYQSPKVQFVCHYIKGLLEQTLGKKDLNEEESQKIRLELDECVRILQKKFLEGRDETYTSYTQLTIFINVLYHLFSCFSESGFLRYDVLSPHLQSKSVAQMRLKLIEGLLITVNQFTSRSIEKIRKSQNRSMQAQREGALGAEVEIGESLCKAVVSWDSTQPFFVVFGSDRSPIFVYKHKKDIPQSIIESVDHQMKAFKKWNKKAEDPFPEYNNCSQAFLFQKLGSLTNWIYKENVCLKCFKRYPLESRECTSCNLALLVNDTKNSSQDFIQRIAHESSKDYALTPDNFIKMLLVLNRVEAKIPVIIMGETGCGKTSLVRYLCSRVLGNAFHIFSIHGGINQEHIVEEMNKYIDEAKNGAKLWIFFDEFNTTPSISLIKEIICERTMLGMALPENMVFIGACNPLRFKTQKSIFDDNVGIKKDRLEKNNSYNLLYTVHPLPETMIEYAWDYGHLDEDTERKYVQVMLSSLREFDDQLKEKIISLVCAAQQQIKQLEDVSSVSLRDVARYKILLEWFLESKNKRNTLSKRVKCPQDVQKEAIILALLHNYYLRISSKRSRDAFLEALEPKFGKFKMSKNEVRELLEKEEDDFLDRMILPPNIVNIAKNQALKENVFALVVCILTKIPIFICGKPGCSKSLAVQTVFNNLRGKNSKDEYFRTLPELIAVSYQGSEYSTSKTILDVFGRAERYLTITQKKEILPVIIFDEIGLAELSVDNPLKVLHSKLEIENIKVSFVGISNWRLDASKMNRALYLARPDPGKKDLVFTAEAICGNINLNTKNTKIIENLAIAYAKLREYLKTSHKKDIFGLRDYYYLIQGFSSDLRKSKNEVISLDYDTALYSIIYKNIKKNFSGLDNEANFFWEQFCSLMGILEKEHQIRKDSTIELIFNSLNHCNGRYLMIITKSDFIYGIVEYMIRTRHKKVKTLVGSSMPDDLSKPAYGFRVLSNIILYIESGYTLIFNKIDRVYSSLYDLFNQNFSLSGGNAYCRIALGAIKNPKCLVNKDFHCVIFITEDEVKKADPPFLNRFEKYKINIEDILPEKDRMIKEKLEKWVHSIVGHEGNSITPKIAFVNSGNEYLFNLVINAKKEFDTKKQRDFCQIDEEVLEVCKKEIIQTATSDFPIMVVLNVKNQAEQEHLLNIYYQSRPGKFQDFISKVLQAKQETRKSVIYTYTQTSDNILYHQDEAIMELKLGSFKSENEVVDQVAKFCNSSKQLLIFRIDLNKESEHLKLIKNLILNTLSSTQQPKKQHFMIIVHLQRFNATEASVTTHFHDWQSLIFDDLNEDYIIPYECIQTPSFKKLAEWKALNPLECLLPDLLDQCLSKINYNVPSGFEKEVNSRRNDMLEKLTKEKQLWNLIKEKIISMIAVDQSNRKFKDWRHYVFQQKWEGAGAVSTFEAINLALFKYYEGYMMKIVFHLEREMLLDAYLEALSTKEGVLLDFWCKKFNEMKINVNERLDNRTVGVDLIFGITFPFSTYEEIKIKAIQEDLDKIKKEEDPSRYDDEILEKLLDSSFIGEELYEAIFERKNLFQKFMDDQLILYLKREKIDVSLDIANIILENLVIGNSKSKLQNFLTISKKLSLVLILKNLVMNDSKSRLQFFLTNSRKFSLVLGVVEALLTLKDGQEILGNFFAEFEKPRYSNGDDFLDCLFQNIIEEISSYNYLAQFTHLEDIKAAFRKIEEKIVKTSILPDSFEYFRPWTCLIKFFEAVDKNPGRAFFEIVKWMKDGNCETFADSECQNTETFIETGSQRNSESEISEVSANSESKKPRIFADSRSIDELMNYLREKVCFSDHIEKTDRERKLVKLRIQLYKNLTNFYLDKNFQQVFKIIEDDDELWQSSAQIIQTLDKYTEFSNAIMVDEGRFENSSYFRGDDTFLEELLLKSPNKTVFMLANKTFVALKTEWENNENVIEEYFETFQENIGQFKYYSELAQKNDWSKTTYPIFLATIIWLKAYLFYYSQALQNDEKDVAVLKNIDELLGEKSPELSTLKLYVIKNLKLNKDRSLNDLREEYDQRNVEWIKPLLKEIPNPNKSLNIEIIPPLPLNDKEEYQRIEDLLNEVYKYGDSRTHRFIVLCQDSSKKYDTLVCIYSWFVKLYMNYLLPDYRVDKKFAESIQKSCECLRSSLGQRGYDLITLLLTNFTEGAYFRLEPNMKNEEIHKRLAVLNVLIILISQTSLSSSAFGQIFLKNRALPENLAAHLEESCLFGQLENNFTVSNMKDVKANIERRLQQNLIKSGAKYIYKCSPDCEYLYNFQQCGKPVGKSKCGICENEIGASSYNTLLKRNNGKGEQVRMTIPDGLKYIDDYVKAFEERERKGYIFNSLESNGRIDTKHTIEKITFRVLHFILHTLIFCFIELGWIDQAGFEKILKEKQEMNSLKYFKTHMLQDYKMIGDLLMTKETHIWIYQLLAGFEGIIREKDEIKNISTLNKFEKRFEDVVIFPVIKSVNTTIQNYKRSFADYRRLREGEDITIFIDELQLDQKQYPWLEFFNYLKFPDFTDFENKYALLAGGASKFPLLDFVTKRHEELANTIALPIIVDFTNELIKKWNYQLPRDKANATIMSYFLREDSHLESKFENFKSSWNGLHKIPTVQVGCQSKSYMKISRENSISLLLPNSRKDDSGIMILGTMLHLAILQNEFIYMATKANNPHKSLEEIIEEETINAEVLQTIKTDQVAHINKNLLMSDIISTGYIHNYEYGKGREIIYDFEEIESRLSQYTIGKKVIDQNKWKEMNYQFELYPENTEIITDIRKRTPQKKIDPAEKALYRNKIRQISNNSKKELLHYLGSLDYVFTYLRNIRENGEQKLEDFCKEKIVNYKHLNQHIISMTPLSTVCLKHIIDLYETVEEVAFDVIIHQDYIRTELLEEISEEKKLNIIKIFTEAVLMNPENQKNPQLKDLEVLVKVLKRLIVRVLLTQEKLDVSLQEFLVREDMWDQDTDLEKISNIELGDEIQLKHAYFILRHLEGQIVEFQCQYDLKIKAEQPGVSGSHSRQRVIDAKPKVKKNRIV